MTRCGVIWLLVNLAINQINATLDDRVINEENTNGEPIQLPVFSQLAHGVNSGPIIVLNNKTLFIPELYYDGNLPDAHFWVGNGSQPSITGVLVPDENGSNKTLSSYKGKNVTITLPNNLTVDQIDHFGIWRNETTQSFGHVTITQKLPLGVQLQSFKQLAHQLRSGPIIIVDQKTFFIPNLHYDGTGPDAHFWVGKGLEPSPTGTLVPDENGSKGSILAYTGQNIYITLPEDLTMDQIDYFGVWCQKNKQTFGYVAIPKNLTTTLETYTNPQFTSDNKKIVRIQKCCPMGQVLSVDGCDVGEQNFEPVIDVHVHNSTHIDDEPIAAETIRFAPFVNAINCEHGSYPLMPEQDRFALLENGSLVVLNTQKILSEDNYCMETIYFGDEDEPMWITTPLICFSSGEAPTSSTIFFIYAVGITISALCLYITALVFLLVKEVRDARGKCVVAYSISMAIAFTCLAVAQSFGIDDATCNIIGFAVQFFLVSSFTWLTMVSWETYYKIKHHNSDAYTKDRKRLYIYIPIGVLVPVLTLIISIFADGIPDIPSTILKPHFGKNSCFFDQEKDTLFYFYIPISIAIIINIILAVLMKWNLWWFQKNRKSDISWITIKLELKPMFRSCLFLLAIMTLCWVMEIVSFMVKSNGGVWIAIDFINSLQGLFVLVVFVLHRPVKDKICKVRKMHRSGNKLEEHETPLKANGTAIKVDHIIKLDNHHNDFLTNLRHVDSVEDMT